MKRRCRSLVRVCSCLAVAVLTIAPTACDYNDTRPRLSKKKSAAPIEATSTAKPAVSGAAASTSRSDVSAEQKERSEAILSNVITIIRSAGTSPGGKHFMIATDNLNRYFDKSSRPTDFAMKSNTRTFLASQIPEQLLRQTAAEESAFNSLYDCRHIEDCMLYNEVANRVAGDGDDLTRVRRVFDWMVRNVQLVPPNSLAMTKAQQDAFRADKDAFREDFVRSPYFAQQAQSRPYDMLLRGMATEDPNFGSERGWLFMALCRQIGVDVGLLWYSPPKVPELLASPENTGVVVWVCAAIIDDKAYLFDQRLGVPIPDASGKGVATLEEAMTNPAILDRMNLPGQAAYPTRRADLLNSEKGIGVFIDSSPGYFSPKMRLLQARLVGKDRTILYRDPIEQYERISRALGSRLDAQRFQFWSLPLQVHLLLFGDPVFVRATQAPLQRFDGALPLLYARMAQLKGQTAEAIAQYVKLRFTTNGLLRDGKTRIPSDVQRELDIYATMFLAQCHLDQKNSVQATRLFEQLLKITPEPVPGQTEKCTMYRWGAQMNLGLIARDRNDVPTATRYLSQRDPTPQQAGNLIIARDLLWPDPTAGIAPKLAPAPNGFEIPQAVFNR